MRCALTTALAAVVLVASPAARALQVQTAVSAQRVAAGDSFVVQLTAMSDGNAGNHLSDPRLPLPPGMTASAPNASPQSQVSIINGQMSQHTGVTVTWTVTTSKVGTFRVGPPSIVLGSERAQGQVISVEVLPAGSNPGGARQKRRAFDPFNFMDPFGNGSPFGHGSPFPPGFNFPSPFDDSNTEEEQAPRYPDEMRVDKAPDPLAFLRATVVPQHVVVGEQVTLRVFAYGGRGQFDLAETHEPTHADFLSFDGSPQQIQPYLVPIGDTRYIGVKLRELYLFPLHSGSLRAGNMTANFTGRNYRQLNGQWPVRDSGAVDVIVTEPPLRGRPPGYKIGDVGEYKLEATVEPREVMAGESIAVVATLSGTGNVPFKILTPERRGVEWLDPALSEHIEWPHGIVQGSRTFSYVVRLNEPGKLDLGELTLPYYDPKRHEYAIARAALGTIDVKPNPNAKLVPPEQKQVDRLAGALQLRDRLGPFAGAPKPLSDRPNFFGLLLLAPLGVVSVGGVLNLVSRTREKLRVRGTSLTAQLETALRDAKSLAKSDASAAVNALERAVFLAIELKLGFKARAVLKTDLARVLSERGLPSERAQALARILEDGDTLRFVGAASGVDPLELARRAETTIAELRADKLGAES
jgi:hypothetical protein